MDLKSLTLEELIELYKQYVDSTDGAAFYIKLLHDKGWITNDKEGDTK